MARFVGVHGPEVGERDQRRHDRSENQAACGRGRGDAGGPRRRRRRLAARRGQNGETCTGCGVPPRIPTTPISRAKMITTKITADTTDATAQFRARREDPTAPE